MYVVIVLLALLVCVNSHAVLVSPIPYYKNPTTVQKCGGSLSADMLSTPMATWRAGQEVPITWHLVASDGGGDLQAFFDSNGGTNFTISARSAPFKTSGSNVVYNLTLTVPSDLSCGGQYGLCTLRLFTPSNWNSCTTVRICSSSESNCEETPTPPLVCQTLKAPLTFCPNASGAQVSEGYSANDIDKELSYVYDANLNNVNVFTTPTGECPALYKTLLCALSLPQCNPSTGSIVPSASACKSQCEKTMKACSVTDIHKYLYDCDTLPPCDGEVDDTAGGNSGMSPGGAAALSIFLIALVASVSLAGYVYYKQGHLFGYKFDHESKKFVKVPPNPHNYNAFVDN